MCCFSTHKASPLYYYCSILLLFFSVLFNSILIYLSIYLLPNLSILYL